jgi:KaiC/GvpD/RAD55 family RecA-like ATPase
MSNPLEQAKILRKQLEREGSVEALHKLSEFMAAYSGENEVISSEDLLDDIEKFEKEERHLTGIKQLDDILDGFRSNQVIAVAAPTKAGKTQFCVHLARALKNTTMFLFEESAPEVLYKYHKKGMELPRFYTPRSVVGMDLDTVYLKMIEAWAKYDSRIFFIDHLHYLLDDENINTTYKIKMVMQQLKEFAKRHNFTIFIVAHIKHIAVDQPPGAEAIRDSSFVAQYADTTIMLWRETHEVGARGHKNVINYTNNLLVNVYYNRKINFTDPANRNTGLVNLTFNTETWSYDETDWYTYWMENGQKEEEKSSSILKNIKR